MSSKSKLNLNKSTLSETPNNKVPKVAQSDKASSVTPDTKVSPATPKVSKVGRGVVKSDIGSPSPVHSARASVERSPGSVISKPLVARKSPKLSTTPDKQPNQLAKGSELQVQLNLVQEDLKKANEKLAEVEKEKTKALDELKEAQRLADEANGKLATALVAQKRAEERSESEKYRTTEMEQAGAYASQKKKEEWDKEIEDVRDQHSLDIIALLSATQELDKVKQELAMISDAKNMALCHADEATKIAEIHAEKVETLSAELVRLKDAFNSKNDLEVNNNNMVSKLKTEVQTLEQELEKSRTYEKEVTNYRRMVTELESEIETLKYKLQKENDCQEKLAENGTTVEELTVELEAARIAEACVIAKTRDYETEATNYRKIVEELKLEVDSLKQKIEKANVYEQKLVENELALEQLNIELKAARTAESNAHNLVEDLQKRVVELELHSEQASRSERSASDSLDSVMKQLEKSNDLLHDAESEVASLKEKLGLLEMSIESQRIDLEESERSVDMAKKQASEMAEQVESLKYALDTAKDEKTQALNSEKLAAASAETLREEKDKLVTELDTSREEEEKSKKAMDSLVSALHEVSSEARDMKEKLLSSQDEHEILETQIENLKLVLRESKEKSEGMLDDAKHEIDVLNQLFAQSKHDQMTSKANWEQKELHLMDRVNNFKEENSSLTEEVSRLVRSLEDAKTEVCSSKEEEVRLKNILAEAECEVDYLQKVLGETKAESMRLRESLMDKENELQSIIEENEELQSKESASVKKADEYSKLLEEAMTRERAELTDSEKDYDMLPKIVEFSEQNGYGKDDNSKSELPHQSFQVLVQDIPLEESNAVYVKGVDGVTNVKDLNGKPDGDVNKKKEDKVEAEFKMWESCKIEDKDFLEPEKESDEELDLKAESESFDQINGSFLTEHPMTENIESGGSSPTKELSQKKKKPLLRKFGSLLKKRASSNQK